MFLNYKQFRNAPRAGRAPRNTLCCRDYLGGSWVNRGGYRHDDVLDHLDTLRRPRLLIRAARIGLQDHGHDGHLRRLLPDGATGRGAGALRALIGIEAEIDAQRRAGAAGYSACRHVDVLIAMMGEARLLRAMLAAG